MSRVLKALFPITTGAYWFMTAFIGLMIVEPFLNQFVHCLSKENYTKLLIVGVIILVLVPINTWSSDLLWFIFLYFVAGYIRLYDLRWLTSQKRRLFIGIGCFALMWLASIVFSVAATRFPAIKSYINYFGFRQNSLPMFIGCVAIFLWVLNMTPIYNQFLNRIAKHVLACYLIQSNVFWSSRLWEWVDSIIPKQGYMYAVTVIGMVLGIVVSFMLFDIVLLSIINGMWRMMRGKKGPPLD